MVLGGAGDGNRTRVVSLESWASRWVSLEHLVFPVCVRARLWLVVSTAALGRWSRQGQCPATYPNWTVEHRIAGSTAVWYSNPVAFHRVSMPSNAQIGAQTRLDDRHAPSSQRGARSVRCLVSLSGASTVPGADGLAGTGRRRALSPAPLASESWHTQLSSAREFIVRPCLRGMLLRIRVPVR
jgi:hypothetical protein